MAIQPIGTAPPAYTPTVTGEASHGRITSAPSQTAEPTTTLTILPPQQVNGNEGGSQEHSIKKADLEQAVKKVNEFVQSRASDVQFSLDEETGIRVVKVVDRSTKEVIRQIPSEEMLHIAQALDKLQGLLIRQKA